MNIIELQKTIQKQKKAIQEFTRKNKKSNPQMTAEALDIFIENMDMISNLMETISELAELYLKLANSQLEDDIDFEKHNLVH